MLVANKHQLVAAGATVGGVLTGATGIALDNPVGDGLFGVGLGLAGLGAFEAWRSTGPSVVPMSQIGKITNGMEFRGRALGVASALAAVGLLFARTASTQSA